MKMKKYNAPSIAEAMKMIRQELGEDAVILNSKVVVKKKFLGLIKNKSFEVLAGLDQVEQMVLKPTAEFRFEKQKAEQNKVTSNEPLSNSSGMSEELKKEIDDLKSLMQTLHRQTIQTHYPDELLPIISFLKKQELSEELTTFISDELFAHSKTQAEPLSKLEMIEFVRESLCNRIKHSKLGIGGLSYERKYINILGPTGVGKTTTIAKMAARAVLEKKKKIGFITTDTYRIGAIEQLKTYASLLQAPLEIVYNYDDYKQAIEKLSSLDLVFIDTAGRNYKEAKYVDDLQKLINFDEDAESYLVLSLTAKEKDMETIVQQFKEVPVDKLIFTKIDETNSIGAMFNLMIKYNKGLAYYTNGQEVPEDIEEASLEKLLDLFFLGVEE